MGSIYFGLGKDKIQLFEVTRMWGDLTEKYQGSLSWFFYEKPLHPPKGVSGIYPTRNETYLEITYSPEKVTEEQIKNYLNSIGIEVGKAEDYQMTFGKFVLKLLLIVPSLILIMSLIVLDKMGIINSKRKED